MSKFTVIKTREVSDVVVIDAANAREAYEKAVDAFFPKDLRAEDGEMVITDDVWLWTDVYEGDIENEPSVAGSDDEPILHVDGN
jgi:hypothetical protein